MDIRTIAVIGAGDMGHGIAEVAALAGFRVWLFDVNDAALERGKERIYASLEKLTSKGRVSRELADQIRESSLTGTTDLAEAVSAAEFVVEAVPEILELKRETFRRLDELASSRAILASNTSTMSVTELGAMTNRPSQVLGFHFFNPPVLMRLVEVIRGVATSDDTIESALALAKAMGKTPVLVQKDTPGFIVNRVNAASTVLFQSIVERKEIEPEPLDAFMRSLGHPFGPKELTDYIGVDVAVSMGRYLADTLHPDYAPALHLVEMADAGLLGKKSGRGYYDWSEGRPTLDFSKATRALNPLLPLFAQINEATKLVEQGVCSTGDVELAMRLGNGLSVGPMTWAKSFSKWDLSDQLESLAARYEKEIFRPTQRVREGGHKR